MAKTGQAKAYLVEVDRDEEGWFVATVPDLDGCHTQGRSIAQAVNRAREAMELYGVSSKAPITITYKPAIGRRVLKLHALREEADRITRDAQEETQKVAAALVKQGLSVRDVGELLGVSHQRVQQLVKG